MNNTQKNTIGQRLREERKRLGLSQEEFGRIGGVKKLAQINYEKDLRTPSYKYFDNLRENQEIDIEYILTGINNKNRDFWLTAEARINTLIAMALDLYPTAFSKAIDEAYHQQIDAALGAEPPVELVVADTVDERLLAVENEVNKVIDNSPRVIDFEILEKLIAQFDLALSKLDINLSSEKKATMIVILYRTFKTSGRVQTKTIEDMIKLSCN